MGTYKGDGGSYPNNITTFEETDLVLAGSDNIPLQQLADRTEYLKNHLGQITNLVGDQTFTGSATIDASFAGKLVVAVAPVSTAITITMADVTTFPAGAIIPFTSYARFGGVVNVVSAVGGQYFYDIVDGNRTAMYMHHKEHMLLVASGNHWKVANASETMYQAGEELKARTIMRNTFALKGDLYSRVLYPRMWEFIQTKLTAGHEVVSDSVWLSAPLTYRGLFSLGDGSTTFRVPDERGMAERMLDLSRGVDLNRSWNFAGGYEADLLKTHNHTIEKVSTRGYPDGSGDRSSENYWMSAARDVANARFISLSSAGEATENTVKNIGKYNLIRF